MNVSPKLPWPPGDSPMAALVRAHDWAATPLGPLEGWPHRLRVTVDLVLAGGFPMVALWGPQLVQLYNDGYRALMGFKHSEGLGQPTRGCWPEVWHINAPIYARVLAGETVTLDDALYPITRSGVLEDAWFTLAYSPLRDETGAIAGVLVTVFETTARHSAQASRQASDRALRERDESLQIAVDAADLGTWDLDLATGRSAVRSLRHDQIFGYTELQAEWGRQISERHVLPEDLAEYRAAFKRAAETGALQCEVRVRWPDGSMHWIALRGRTYYDTAGRPVRMAGVVADITGRKQAEQRLHLITEVARDYAIYVSDAHDRITEWLPGAAAVFGWTADEAIGQPGGILFTPEDRAAGVPGDELETACRQGRAPNVRWQLRKDGSRVFIEGSATALRDAEGHLQGFLKIGQDITERRAAEQALRTSEQRLRLIAENVSVGQFTWDLTTGLLTLPPLAREAFGFVDRPIHIDRIFEAIHPDDLPAVRAGVEPAFDPSGDGAMRASYRIVRPDGSMRWVDSAGQVQFETQPDGSRRAVHAVGVIWDVTEHRLLVERLRQADERKNEFLAMLAHELRNPLAPLTNAHRLIERTEPLTERGLAALALAQRQTQQLRRLVDDLLEISRITLGKIEIRPEPMSVSAAVHAAVESVAPAIEQRDQTIEIHVPPSPVRIQADPMRLAQVLENLLTNASKYTPQGGSIRIEVGQQADAVEIRVIDDGLGIEPAKLGELFEVFHQIDATIDRAQGGLGIGLALVKRLVELHGGTVAAASPGLGKGAVFTVRLPRGARAGAGQAGGTDRPAACDVSEGS